ncbi:NAD(P)-dependent alcohol dehydrogenase [Asanoa sp. WMMD1127]|uniref:NAD(P)-dependent alcohol dehydrogenase n=1 Tax=Asanoa sp. WMMD1127 TaxID=3016107 RepID=UPI0024164E72|nr:NAD(P)-dependent alcohol dehydrogenase [Asanoa sp. WMMD1127]MDG4826729.1 NAD(P)-dependent alcohol dehydrogenase [Asanoa sp. WMMD1127]
MKAIAQSRYGPADVLSLREVPRPVAGAAEVLVQVRAAGVDPGVWINMTGQPYAARAAFGLTRPRIAVRGRALAGVVAEVGPGVTTFQPGDEVYGTTGRGSFAEFAVAPVKWLARKPATLSFEQAAAVPISAVTALAALRAVRAGQRVMVIGAAGGIGAYAVQLAVARGARVTGVCGTDKVELVRSLGADEVVDYTAAEVDRDGPVHDVVVDTAGCRPLSLLRRAAAPRGVVVLAGGGHDSGGLLGGMTRLLRVPFVAARPGARFQGLFSGERAAELDELRDLIDAGAVRPVIDRVYPLAEAPDAIRYLALGHPAGKVVLTV